MSEVILICGLPGAGKGTQAKLLEVDRVGIHVSCGALFRWHVEAKTELGMLAQSAIRKGGLTADDIACKIFLEHLEQLTTSQKLLIEGFPRTLNQAARFDEFLDRRQWSIELVIVLNVPHVELARRLSNRRICPKCGETYSRSLSQMDEGAKCEKDGAVLLRRSDDDPAVIPRRLEVYESSGSAVVARYRSKGLLVEIDGSEPVDVVAENIRQCLK